MTSRWAASTARTLVVWTTTTVNVLSFGTTYWCPFGHFESKRVIGINPLSKGISRLFGFSSIGVGRTTIFHRSIRHRERCLFAVCLLHLLCSVLKCVWFYIQHFGTSLSPNRCGQLGLDFIINDSATIRYESCYRHTWYKIRFEWSHVGEAAKQSRWTHPTTGIVLYSTQHLYPLYYIDIGVLSK